MFPKVTVSSRLLIFCSLLLTGCFDGNVKTEELCQNHSELQCKKLNINDGRCRIPRTNLIWHRFEQLQVHSEANQIKEYGLLAEYRKCLELASQITPIDQNELKRNRFDALIHTIKELDRIVNELQNSTQPATLYFLWSQTANMQAKRLFLRMEGSPKLNTAEMQYALATFYAKRDPSKTIQLLNNALTMSNKNNLKLEILNTLASLNQELGHKEQAYMWAMVAKQFDVPIASKDKLERMFTLTPQSKYEQLADLAKRVAKSLKKGAYSPEQVNTYLEAIITPVIINQ
ncbi:DUF2989 domain-containing protein [Vibrio sagamiensis]|uniref:DUF2989 domain-containing protein n=1 Tax=Vibrio sagamiensis TaxID=512650 RepID=UPI00039F0902|nr:DUF2989 domain-containing protein [Vibrio sagamiensis]PNQ58687.1 DUF2989 domain-containing protein [Vibrio agarivorans]